jgi:colanic acid/amylovoran biosynthesis protein
MKDSKNKNLVEGYFQINLGDDIFLEMLVERYKNEQFEIFSKYNYKDIVKSNNLNVKSNKNIYNIIIKILNRISSKKLYTHYNLISYKTVIRIGGSLFMESTDSSVNKRTKRISQKYLLGANFGPYKSNEYLSKYKNQKFMEYKDICFRDEYSYSLFKELKNVRKAPDIVFGLDTSNIKITDRRRVIISVINCTKDSMNLDSDLYERKIIELIKFFKEKNYEILLMSFSKIQGDEDIINDIKEKSNIEGIDTYFYSGNIEEALNVIGDSSVVVGTRFHANILGMIMNKTVIPIAYSNKTVNILKDINFQGLYFDLNDIENFKIDRITEYYLNYKQDVTFEKKEAEKQFLGLDKIFNK